MLYAKVTTHLPQRAAITSCNTIARPILPRETVAWSPLTYFPSLAEPLRYTASRLAKVLVSYSFSLRNHSPLQHSKPCARVPKNLGLHQRLQVYL